MPPQLPSENSDGFPAELQEALGSKGATRAARWRARLLYSYEQFYFKSLLRTRKYSSLAKYLMLMGLVSVLMSFDSKRYAMQYVFALIVMLFVYAYMSNRWRTPKNLKISRELPAQVEQGDLFEYFICIKNEGEKKSASFMLKDLGRMHFPSLWDWYRLDAPFENALNAFDRLLGYPKWLYLVQKKQEVLGSDLLVPEIEAGKVVRLRATGMAQKRGYCEFVGLAAALEDPFGLLRKLWFIEAEDRLLVTPKPSSLGVQVQSGQSNKMGSTGVGFKAQDLQDFRALRAWRPGDSIKHIDWRATARLNEPICKEFSSPQSFESVLVVESWAPDTAAALMLDKNMEKVFYLLEPRNLMQLPIGFVVTRHGHQEIVSEKGYALATSTLASLEKSEQSDLELLKEHVTLLQNQCSSVILILTHWSDAHQAWIESLQAHGLGVSLYLSSLAGYGKNKLKMSPTVSNVQHLEYRWSDLK